MISLADGVPTVGVLALQGDFREHRETLERLGANVKEIRLPQDMRGVDALVLPGGESTAISKLLESSGLFEIIADRFAAGMPGFGTCAGMILMAGEIIDGIPDQKNFGVVDVAVRRNGIGRQIASYEGPLEVAGLDVPVTAIFIRPPVVESVGSGVEVLAETRGHAVLCRQGSHLVASFHPEISGDSRIHQMFLDGISTAQTATAVTQAK